MKFSTHFFSAYLNGLHSQRARGVSHSEIWIFVAAACTITLILLATGVAVAHKKKKRKNSVNSDRTNMAFCEDQTAHRDVICIVYICLF